MRDVCAATGLSKWAIHLYVRQGLLPSPEKTSRNQAFYDEDFVRRAQLIRVLQETMHLPLASIRDTLNTIPKGQTTEVDVEQFSRAARAFSEIAERAYEPELSREELLSNTSVKDVDLKQLQGEGLIKPTRREGRDYFSPMDVRILRAVSRGRDAISEMFPGFERGEFYRPNWYAGLRTYLAPLARIFVEETSQWSSEHVATQSLDDFFARVADTTEEVIAAVFVKMVATEAIRLAPQPQRTRSAKSRPTGPAKATKRTTGEPSKQAKGKRSSA